MTSLFDPCTVLDHDNGTKSLCFSRFDAFTALLESRGGQGGGYSWEALVQAVMAMRGVDLPDLEFDPEGDMFCVVAQDEQSLVVVASIIRDLCNQPELMDKAIALAISEEYFE